MANHRQEFKAFSLSQLSRELFLTDSMAIGLHTLHSKENPSAHSIRTIREVLLKREDTTFYYSLLNKNISALAMFFNVKLLDLRLCISTGTAAALSKQHFQNWCVRAFANIQTVSLELETTAIKEEFVETLAFYSRHNPGKLKDINFECKKKFFEKNFISKF